MLSKWEYSIWLPLDETLINHRLASSRRWYSFTYPGRMESRVSLGGKEGCTNIWISAKPGIELGTLWSECRDLTNCTNHACSVQLWQQLNKICILSVSKFWILYGYGTLWNTKYYLFLFFDSNNLSVKAVFKQKKLTFLNFQLWIEFLKYFKSKF